MAFLFGDHDLVDLFARPDPGVDDRDVAAVDERVSHVDHPRGRHDRHVRFSRQRMVDRREDGVHRSIEAEQKARHLAKGNRDGASLRDLIDEERHHGTA